METLSKLVETSVKSGKHRVTHWLLYFLERDPENIAILGLTIGLIEIGRRPGYKKICTNVQFNYDTYPKQNWNFDLTFHVILSLTFYGATGAEYSSALSVGSHLWFMLCIWRMKLANCSTKVCIYFRCSICYLVIDKSDSRGCKNPTTPELKQQSSSEKRRTEIKWPLYTWLPSALISAACFTRAPAARSHPPLFRHFTNALNVAVLTFWCVHFLSVSEIQASIGGWRFLFTLLRPFVTKLEPSKSRATNGHFWSRRGVTLLTMLTTRSSCSGSFTGNVEEIWAWYLMCQLTKVYDKWQLTCEV